MFREVSPEIYNNSYCKYKQHTHIEFKRKKCKKIVGSIQSHKTSSNDSKPWPQTKKAARTVSCSLHLSCESKINEQLKKLTLQATTKFHAKFPVETIVSEINNAVYFEYYPKFELIKKNI